MYFPALQSAIIDQPKVPNRHDGGIDGGLAEKIIEVYYAEDDESIAQSVNVKIYF